MAKRTILIQSPCRLSVSNSRLRIERDGQVAHIPLSDIWVLILESHLTTASVALLSSLNEAGIGVIVCGKDHMPNGLCLPIGAHSRHSAIVEHQLLISAPLRKNLWKVIVEAKIANQTHCAQLLGRNTNKLAYYASHVRSDDAGGAEAAAAAEYFRQVLPAGTRRNGPYAAPLDYGYAVLRASVARCCVAGGWLVSRGIHHDSNLNAFNLADDLIEPFRPFVDYLVLSSNITEPLTPQSKRQLVGVLENEVLMNDRHLMVQTATEEVLQSFKRAILSNDSKELVLPTFSQ